ncbi:hypothetical protein [Celeribacter naphthalenivorans]|uniref:hypothetical protein n=1 Tax=Celeribacter naphthalenivorans TaxID=1614694 RepID=UPI001CF94187|nr:hypothetical protein [Celeribacter naphthalenivorans]
MTGSIVDHDKFFKKYGVPYDPIKQGTPTDFGGTMIHVPGKRDVPVIVSSKIKHIRGEHATKFNTPEDYVKAYEWIKNSPAHKAFESGSKAHEPNSLTKMSDVFGPHFQARIKGYGNQQNRQ